MGWRNLLRKNTKLEKILILFAVVLCAVVLVLFIILLSGPGQQICDSPECVRAASHILDTVDPTVDPCNDFYKFACGTFLKNAFSLGQPSTLHHLRTLMNNKLREIVIEKDDKKNISRGLQLQKKFYRTCINDTIIDADNDETFLRLLDDVTGGWPVVKEGNWNGGEFNWTNSMIKARKLGFFYQFYFRVNVFHGNDSTNMIWIRPPDEKDIASFYWSYDNRQFMTEIAADLGARSRDTFREIGYTISFAEQLNLIIQEYYNNTKRDPEYNRRISTIKNLKHKLIDINWLEFLQSLTGVNITEEDLVVFDVDSYFESLYYLLFKTYRKTQANYIAWVIISTNIQYMSRKIREKQKKVLKINITEHNLSRSDLCYKAAIEFFKNVAEGEYVRRYTPRSKLEYVKEIIKNVKTELQSLLENIPWMDKETRSYAVQHLKNITEEVGWTKLVYDAKEFEKLFGYHQVKMPSDKLVDMARLMNINAVNQYYRQLKQTADEEEQEYINTPKLDVNAFYMKYFDKLVLPTPILQGLVIDEHRPHYMNYGSLGSIIGHEFMHGLIDFYSNGTIDEDFWWTNKSIKNFKKVSQCIINDYSRYPDKNGFNNSGTVFEENIADFSGVNLAYSAYKKWARRNKLGEKLPGVEYTADQLFWIMTGTYLCYETKLSEKDEYKRKVPIHAAPSYRVSARLRNSPHFAKAFNCPIGSPMNPEKKCQIFA